MEIQRGEEQVSCRNGVHDSHGGSCSCEDEESTPESFGLVPIGLEDLMEVLERLKKRVAASEAARKLREEGVKIDWQKRAANDGD